MPSTRIIQYWGDDRLFRWDAAALANLNVPSQSKDFLAKVGLPMRPHKAMTFGGHAFAMLPAIDVGHRHLRLIGTDLSRFICIDEALGGRVVWVEPRRNVLKFVNSSVEQLGTFLTAFSAAVGGRTSITWADGRAIEAALRSDLRLVDGPAFANNDDFWPIALEQLGV